MAQPGKKISAIIFDMDGLIFDTERISIPAWQKAGRQFGYEIAEPHIIQTIGFNLQGTEGVLKGHYGSDFPFQAIRALKVLFIKEGFVKNAPPLKAGIRELLEWLGEINFPVGLGTSSERVRVLEYLDSAKISPYFNVVVCGDEVKNGKPAPDIFLAVAGKLGIPPPECVVLEDSENGIRAAAAAKMIPILVPDIREVPEEAKKLVRREFLSLLEVRDYLKKKL